MHRYVPDTFGGDGKQKDFNLVDESSVGELRPDSSDVRRKLMVFKLVDATVVLIEVVAEVLRAAPEVYMVFGITEVICQA